MSSVSTFSDDLVYLRHAFALAQRAREAGEWPFGALVVRDGLGLAEAEDSCIRLCDPTAHAETMAIRAACQSLRTIELEGATLYASAEPCLLCCGAIHWARIRRVVYGLPQSHLNALSGGREKPGCAVHLATGTTHTEIIGGLLLDEALAPFNGFVFRRKRVMLAEAPD